MLEEDISWDWSWRPYGECACALIYTAALSSFLVSVFIAAVK